MNQQRQYREPQPYCNEARPQIALIEVPEERSGQVRAHGFDEATRTIAIEFRNGSRALYCYPDQPRELYEAFVNAESMGVFHGKHIKDLPFRKFRAEPADQGAAA